MKKSPNLTNMNFELLLKQHIKRNKEISSKDLYLLFLDYFPESKKEEYYKHIYELVKENILIKTSSSSYIYKSDKIKYGKKDDCMPFKPFRNERVGFTLSAWDTDWLGKYSELLPTSNYLIYECEGFAVDHVINKLRAKNIKAYYYKDLNKIRKYIDDKEIVVVKPINQDCPLIKMKDEKTNMVYAQPKLEKMLVDIAVDSYLYESYGSEVPHIYKNVLDKYAINMSTLMRYAKKRKKEDKIMNILNSINYSYSYDK